MRDSRGALFLVAVLLLQVIVPIMPADAAEGRSTPDFLVTQLEFSVGGSIEVGGAIGAEMSGTLSGYNVAASGTSGTTVFTSTSTGNKTDLADSGTGADPFITITQGGMQTVKIGKTLDLTDTASALVLVQKDLQVVLGQGVIQGLFPLHNQLYHLVPSLYLHDLIYQRLL